MKKNMIIIASASVLLLLLGTCSIRRFYYTSFVWAYYQPDSLVLTCYEKTAFAIDFNISREEFYANHVSQESEGLKKEKFDSLCRRYDDFGYNRWIGTSIGSMKNHFLSVDFKSITVTSDVDFDAAHPAGTPLNDITQFAAISPVKYIRSGYKNKCHWYKVIKKSSHLMKRYVFMGDTRLRLPEHFPIDKRLSECTESGFELLMGRTDQYGFSNIGRIGWLQLLQKPKSENYTITVEIVDSQGNIWRASESTANSHNWTTYKSF